MGQRIHIVIKVRRTRRGGWIITVLRPKRQPAEPQVQMRVSSQLSAGRLCRTRLYPQLFGRNQRQTFKSNLDAARKLTCVPDARHQVPYCCPQSSTELRYEPRDWRRGGVSMACWEVLSIRLRRLSTTRRCGYLRQRDIPP